MCFFVEPALKIDLKEPHRLKTIKVEKKNLYKNFSYIPEFVHTMSSFKGLKTFKNI